jgi:hypothetical protein
MLLGANKYSCEKYNIPNENELELNSTGFFTTPRRVRMSWKFPMGSVLITMGGPTRNIPEGAHP